MKREVKEYKGETVYGILIVKAPALNWTKVLDLVVQGLGSPEGS